MLTGRIKGESRSLEKSGKAILSAGMFPLGMSQKTYAMVAPHPCGNMGVCLSQKNGCGAILQAPQPICILRRIYK